MGFSPVAAGSGWTAPVLALNSDPWQGHTISFAAWSYCTVQLACGQTASNATNVPDSGLEHDRRVAGARVGEPRGVAHRHVRGRPDRGACGCPPAWRHVPRSCPGRPPRRRGTRWPPRPRRSPFPSPRPRGGWHPSRSAGTGGRIGRRPRQIPKLRPRGRRSSLSGSSAVRTICGYEELLWELRPGGDEGRMMRGDAV